MCGIAGIYAPSGVSVLTPQLCQTVGTLLRHRGPDDEGFLLINTRTGDLQLAGGDDTPAAVYASHISYTPRLHVDELPPIQANLAFVSRRLAIQDLSPAGHMPMGVREGDVWLTFNGQVYNFHELRAELASAGHQFESAGDTEVILKAYLQWGPGCVQRFNGMWAIALWDGRRGQLLLSRDRLGVKPLYYWQDGSTLAFASEIKCLLAMGAPVKLNEDVAWDYLTLGLVDHTTETFFAGIRKVPPGTTLVVNDNGAIEERCFWDVDISREIVSTRPDRDYALSFREGFQNAVQLRLRSDVTVGSCLSGGLDSSSIVSVANELLRSHDAKYVEQETFSSCAEDPQFDERVYIDSLAQRALFKRHYVFPESDGFLAELPALLWHQEEPFAGTSIYAQWCVMRESRRAGVSVLLDGQGADEQLLGYRKFRFFYVMELARRGHVARATLEAAHLAASPEIRSTSAFRNVRRYVDWRRRLGLKNELFRDESRERDLFSTSEDGTLAGRIRDDIKRKSLPALLRYEDKNSMAHSVEARLPFLDYRLVELIASFPSDQKIRRGWTKFVLRNAMSNYLPDLIRWRRTKLGFVTPETAWFRESLGQRMLERFKDVHVLDAFVNLDVVSSRLERYRQSPGFEDGRLYFRMFILEEWARLFMQSSWASVGRTAVTAHKAVDQFAQ